MRKSFTRIMNEGLEGTIKKSRHWSRNKKDKSIVPTRHVIAKLAKMIDDYKQITTPIMMMMVIVWPTMVSVEVMCWTQGHSGDCNNVGFSRPDKLATVHLLTYIIFRCCFASTRNYSYLLNMVQHSCLFTQCHFLRRGYVRDI